jgi:allantoin racemase
MRVSPITLGVIVPTPRLGKRGVASRIAAYKRCLSLGTKLVLLKTQGGPPSTDSRYEELLAAPYIIQSAKQLVDKRQVDSIIVSCFGDPAVGALREIFDIPIVGPAEASISMAANLGGKFSIVTILENGIPMLEDEIHRLGLSSRLASIRAIGIEPQDLDANKRKTRTAVIREARQALKNDRASSIIIGCNSPEMVQLADELNQNFATPVINPVFAAVCMAESLVRQGLRGSRVWYREPISL